jgi:hypothetical protein
MVTINNRRLVMVGIHDGKFWCGIQVLGDLARDREFRCGKKFNTTGRNSKRIKADREKKYRPTC